MHIKFYYNTRLLQSLNYFSKKTQPHIDIQSCSNSVKTNPDRNIPRENNNKNNQSCSFIVKRPLTANIKKNKIKNTAELKFEFKSGCIAFNESSNELSDWTPDTSSHNMGSSTQATCSKSYKTNRKFKNNNDQSTQLTWNSSLHSKNTLRNSKVKRNKRSSRIITIKKKRDELAREEASSMIVSSKY